ncbi:hypothetical protein ACR820_03675 [Streptomyces netropsis]
MPVSQMIVVSPCGNGTELLNQITTALGYTSRGTMGAAPGNPQDGPGPGEVFPLLKAAYGQEEATRLLRAYHAEQAADRLAKAFQGAVEALWRVWWKRLGQPVTTATTLDSAVEERLARQPDEQLLRLLPGRDCWYVNTLDPQRMDPGLLRLWATTGTPLIICHRRGTRDRITAQVQALSQPADQVGTLPDHLLYQQILSAQPSMDAKLTLALTDPHFPGIAESAHTHWLTHHPAVITLTHEELAGPAYGGTNEARRTALSRLLNATGSLHEPATLPTPHPGHPHLHIGHAAQHFSPHHEHLVRNHPHMKADSH